MKHIEQVGFFVTSAPQAELLAELARLQGEIAEAAEQLGEWVNALPILAKHSDGLRVAAVNELIDGLTAIVQKLDRALIA